VNEEAMANWGAVAPNKQQQQQQHKENKS